MGEEPQCQLLGLKEIRVFLIKFDKTLKISEIELALYYFQVKRKRILWHIVSC